jgi:glucokinase
MPDYIAAVDIGGTNLRLALAQTDLPPIRSIIARSTTSTVGIKDPQLIVNQIHAGITSLLQENNIPKSALKAIAAGAPGITNTDTGVVIVTSYLLGWRDVPLRDLLQNSFHIPAAVDNDGKLAALGEAWAGAGQSSPDFVFLAIGTGVSAGIILNGQLHRGSTFAAGEIGYMLLPSLPDTPAPRGKPGALEASLGGEGLKALWQSQWSESATTLPRDLHATEIFDRALPDNANPADPLAQSLLAHAAKMLASTIYNISLILNVPLFVLGGSVGVHPALIDATAALLVSWGTRVQPRLLPSTLGTDAQLFGALRLAQQKASNQ